MNSGAGDPAWRSPVPAAQIAVVTALELEAAILQHQPGLDQTRFLVSGPGPERASAAALQAVAAGARALIGFGLAGGLSSAALTGAVLLPERLLAADGSWTVDAAWRARLAEALRPEFRTLDLPLFSAESVQTTAADKAALAAATGAAAVDMESAAIARVAAESAIPCVILRVVADGPLDTLPRDAATLVTDDGQTHVPGLLRMLLAPAQWPALIRLARHSQRARAVLRQAAAILAADVT